MSANHEDWSASVNRGSLERLFSEMEQGGFVVEGARAQVSGRPLLGLQLAGHTYLARPNVVGGYHLTPCDPMFHKAMRRRLG